MTFPGILPFFSAVAPIIATGLGLREGARGQRAQNRENVNEATRQMNFQREMAHSAQDFSERMSSTAVQRSVEDYRRAGLNPALAYERSASSPAGVTAGGAKADIGNVSSSALQYAQMKQAIGQAYQAMENQTKAVNAEVDLKTEQGKAAAAAAEVSRATTSTLDAVRPHELRARVLDNIIKASQTPGAQGENVRKMLTGYLDAAGATAKDFWQSSLDFAAPLRKVLGTGEYRRKK